MRINRLIAILFSAIVGLAVTVLLLFLMSKLVSGKYEHFHFSVQMPALVDMPDCPAQKRLEFDVNFEIKDSRACVTDEDCELLLLGCPFGCDVPVNKSSRDKVFRAVNAYADYVGANQCEHCQHGCGDSTALKAVCENKVCKSVEVGAAGGM